MADGEGARSSMRLRDRLACHSMTAESALQPHELLALVGLARILIRADGTFSAEEAAALQDVAAALLPQGPDTTPYREGSDEGPTAEHEVIWALLDRASTELRDEDAVKAVARTVVRPEARVAIYDALFQVASSDVVSSDEWPILDWLAEQWAVESPPQQ